MITKPQIKWIPFILLSCLLATYCLPGFNLFKTSSFFASADPLGNYPLAAGNFEEDDDDDDEDKEDDDDDRAYYDEDRADRGEESDEGDEEDDEGEEDDEDEDYD